MLIEKRSRIVNKGLVLAAALLAALAFAGCGDSSDNDNDNDKKDIIKEPKTWTLAADLPSTGGFSNIAYGKNVFVAATNAKEIIWSSDGVTWHSADGDVAALLNTTGANYVFFGNNEFILAARNNPPEGETVKWAKSTDGKTWTAVTGPGRAAGGGAYGNGGWALGANGGNVFGSADSTNWTAKPTGIADINWVNGVAFGSSKFVITGMGSRIAWSSDTTTWNDATPKDNTGKPLFGGALNDDGTISSGGTINSVVFGNGRFVAAGGPGGSQNIAVTSTDGIIWTQTGNIKLTATTNYIYLGYGAGVFIIGHEDGSAAYTIDADAYNWTLIADTQLTKITGIAYGNGKFVLVGTDAVGPAIAYSTPE
jgi:hypothetical protein